MVDARQLHDLGGAGQTCWEDLGLACRQGLVVFLGGAREFEAFIVVGEAVVWSVSWLWTGGDC